MKHWNSENTILKNSEEYQYLNEFDKISLLAEKVSSKISKIHSNEFYNVKRGGEMKKLDVSSIKNDLKNILEKLEKLVD